MSPKRILFVEPNTDGTIGGSTYCLLEVIKHLDKSRFDPIVAFYRDNILVSQFRKICQVLILEGGKGLVLQRRFPTFYRWFRNTGAILSLLLFAQKTFNATYFVVPWFFTLLFTLLREHIDLVCINNAPLLADWPLVCKLLGRPCVAYFRGTHIIAPQKRSIPRRYDAVMSISIAVTENAQRQGVDVRNFILIHDGIDVEAIRQRVSPDPVCSRKEWLAKPGGFLIGVINNLKEWKGQHVAIEAMRLLRQEHPEIVCLLVGDVADDDDARVYLSRLKKMVVENDLAKNVIFTGYRDDVPNIIAGLDLVLHTSLGNEGFPRVILEAMVLSKPIVASEVGPSSEMLENGVSGFLVPAGDYVALARVILHLYKDRATVLRVGVNGRKRVEQLFNIGVNVKKTEDLFAKLLAPCASVR